jgi:transposase InsO family protein
MAIFLTKDGGIKRDGSNFFGHLKEELFHHVRFLSTDALAAQLKEYIRWYNTERISTKLKGLSPEQYRTQALAASALTWPVQLSGTSSR